MTRATTLTLTADGDAQAAPGETVSLLCRLRSGSAEPIAGALLRFVLPPEIVIAAGEPAATILPPIEPYAELTIARVVTLHTEIGDGAELRIEAVLTLPDGRLQRSNIAALRISSRARLNGPGTSVNVRPIAGREIVVEAHIANDGTAAARTLVIDVPPPTGTATIGPLAETVFTLARLDPGESRTFAYRARVTAGSLQSLRVTGTTLRDGTGRQIALRAGAPLALPATLLAPTVDVARDGRRLRVRVRGSNAGPGCALDVAFWLQWPAAFVCDLASMSWNGARVAPFDRHGAFARADVHTAGSRLSVASIDAGDVYDLAFDLDATAVAAAGRLCIEVKAAADHAVQTDVALDWVPRTDVRMRIVAAPDEAVDVGTRAYLTVALFNAGDKDETIALHVAGAPTCLIAGRTVADPHAGIALAAGECQTVAISLDVPAVLGDGECVALTLTARTNDKDVAHLSCAVRARNRVWIDSAAWFSRENGAGVIRLRNTGSTPARNVTLICDDTTRIEIGDILPGDMSSTRIAATDCARLVHGTNLTVDGQPTLRLDAPEHGADADVTFDAIVRWPSCAATDAIRPVSLHVVCPTALRTLTVRAPHRDTWTIIAGSLIVDGRVVDERDGEPAICAAAGLVLPEIPAGAHIEIGWLVRVHGSPAGKRIGVDLDGDGVRRHVFSQPLRVDSPTPVAKRSARLAFWADAPASDLTAKTALGCDPPTDAVTLFLPFDRAHVDACIRALRVKPVSGAYEHLCTLSAFLPTGVCSSDESLSLPLLAVYEALEVLLGRLALKLRMPHAGPTSRDCDDMVTRRPVKELLAAIAQSSGERDDADDGTRLTISVERAWARQQISRIEEAPPGDAAALGVALALIPVGASGSPSLSRALANYVETLRAALLDIAAGTAARAGTFEAGRLALIDALLGVSSELSPAVDTYAG